MIREEENVRVWASLLDENAFEQAVRTARLQIMAGPVALMPDAHLGIGATVGSVIATENAIIPSAVGVDIGCGMIAIETDLTASDLPQSLSGFMPEVSRSIPAGVGKGHDKASDEAEAWMAVKTNAHLTDKQRQTAAQQFGSLGSGNHFFEICLDERDRVWLVLHSGSRGIGNQLANIHIKLAKAQEQGLEDPDLSYFLQGTPEFEAYIADMLWSQDYAYANRTRMMDSVSLAFFDFVGAGRPTDWINCHHNYSTRERHGGRELWITRKGAIDASPKKRGIIPGSMGAASYIVRGKGNVESYHSAPHGAGRRMSRGQARRELTTEGLNKRMAGKVWLNEQAKELLDEDPLAYKDIDTVMADSADLVTVLHSLRSILNYKGL